MHFLLENMKIIKVETRRTIHYDMEESRDKITVAVIKLLRFL